MSQFNQKNSNLPQIVGNYKFQKYLGHGTFGEVGLYSNASVQVAIKFDSNQITGKSNYQMASHINT
ncbi:UNKNOWN [Stylonychia lemnae]|uniref:Protein kinase domain-containing protein n=1 Tax=Stylonychia lemnae TaxID=5949 RepID=A0A078AKD0_STYLE|nr:UNKNOWN [Stylonychia lemnae]|eukprot:CDW82664.1 UNKNOWN [Stylonychia lemnae]